MVKVENEQESALDDDAQSMPAPQQTLRAPALQQPDTAEDVQHIQGGVDPQHAFQPANFLRFFLPAFCCLNPRLFLR